MKIWQSYGSEHSANLVVIGRFREVKDASKAHELINALTEQVQTEERAGTLKLGEPSGKFSRPMLDLLMKLNVMWLGSSELEQFIYDVTIDAKGKELILTTDELEISAFLKVFVECGARVEMYSAHEYHGTGYGR